MREKKNLSLFIGFKHFRRMRKINFHHFCFQIGWETLKAFHLHRLAWLGRVFHLLRCIVNTAQLCIMLRDCQNEPISCKRMQLMPSHCLLCLQHLFSLSLLNSSLCLSHWCHLLKQAAAFVHVALTAHPPTHLHRKSMLLHQETHYFLARMKRTGRLVVQTCNFKGLSLNFRLIWSSDCGHAVAAHWRVFNGTNRIQCFF